MKILFFILVPILLFTQTSKYPDYPKSKDYTSAAALLLHLPLAGDVNDISIYNRNGTVDGVEAYTTDHNSVANGAFLFDGSTRITVPDFDDYSTAKITIMMWLKAPNVNAQIAYSHYDSGSDPQNAFFRWFVYTTSSRVLFTDLGTTANYKSYYDDGTDPTDGTWHHLCVTYDLADTIKFYGDGNLDAPPWFSKARDDVLTQFFNCTLDIQIGCQLNNGVPANYINNTAAMSDIRVYNRILTLEEIQVIYSQ